ncbi:hypothetical protein WFZ85_12355 [Flavobacterium sp. j3]|uniref:Uncharacterized protein n=1 Tax=Flavobacterium aureirubrum TaxID=3133147 RepID=A0ABU9N9I0_9FLAO
MSRLGAINEILHERYLDGNNFLIEADIDNKGIRFEMRRKIVAKAGLNYTLYKFDAQDSIFPYFKATGIDNLKKMCDYVMFVEDGNHLFIFLIELKKGLDSAKKQLEAGECFTNYIIATIKRLNNEFEFTDANLHYRKIRISESQSKKSTLKKGLLIHNSGVIDHQHPEIFILNEYLSY